MAWLKRKFGVGVVDYSAYWFRRSADHLKTGQRAGLVSTNTLRENKHRVAALDYVVGNGGVITDAVSSQKWPGDAKVHVSITNWIVSPTEPPEGFLLDGRPVEGITSQLRSFRPHQPAHSEPVPLPGNAGRAFIGCYARHSGFQVEESLLHSFAREREDGIVRPWLAGDDISSRPDQRAQRWTVDFGAMPLEAAARWPLALDHVRRHVKPDRESDPAQSRAWWQFWRPRPEMRTALAALPRYVAVLGTGKRLLTAWQTTDVCPSHGVVVIAAQDDWTMGVVMSSVHGAWAWAWARSSTLETRLRYTPSSAFEPFPWPYPTTTDQRERVADVCRRLLARRSAICTAESIGLTKLYNAVDEGAWADLETLHRELDEAVADCYGWSRRVAQDDAELVRRLTALNHEIASGQRDYRPFAHRGPR